MQRIAVTTGDPAGIGPEIIADILSRDPALGNQLAVLGDPVFCDEIKRHFPSVEIEAQASRANQNRFEAGKPNDESARVALDAMMEAASGCRSGRYKGVVTGPVSKANLQKIGFSHAGQTEFFAAEWSGEPSMAFVGAELVVVLATWHIPLSEVPAAYNEVTLELAVKRAHELGKLLGRSDPRIGVCGLNPHAGEGGVLGHEERETLDPCLNRLRDTYPGLSVALPGDTVFMRQRRGEFDVVVSGYHDQALAAVKTLEFDKAVNVTLGLPWIRTSPDHGTGFDIAGKGIASSESFRRAIELAVRLTGGEI